MPKFGLRVDRVGPHCYGNWTRDGVFVAERDGQLVEINPTPGLTVIDVPPIDADTLTEPIKKNLLHTARDMAKKVTPKITDDFTP